MPPINNDRAGRRTVRAGHIAWVVGILAALTAVGLLMAAIALRP
jgi:hypothetical protein